MASGWRRWRVHITVAFGAHRATATVSIVCSMSASEMLPNTPLASTSSAGTAPAYELVSDASPQTTSTPAGAVGTRGRASCPSFNSTSRASHVGGARDARRAHRSGRGPGPRTSMTTPDRSGRARVERFADVPLHDREAPSRARCRDCRRPRASDPVIPSRWSLRAPSRSTRRAREPRARPADRSVRSRCRRGR